MNFDEIKDCDYVVIGDPVAHSVSPPMQNPAFEKLSMGRPYGRIRVSPDDMGEFTDYARKYLKGFNVTVPDKPVVIPFLDSISAEAEAAGSVNTVSICDGKLRGDSTDGYGLETAMDEAFGVKVQGGSFCFIGCGGAVQAVAFHFAAAGAKNLFFINRTVEKARQLCERLKSTYASGAQACGLDDLNTMRDFVRDSQVLIQGSSIGLKKDDPCPIPAELLDAATCCYDTIYKNTVFLQEAARRGLKIADGRTMLLHQGARSFEIWTGIKPDVELMRQALYRELDSR